MERRIIIFQGWFTRRQFEDPRVTSSNIHILIFWKNDFSNYAKNYIVLSKNTRKFKV